MTPDDEISKVTARTPDGLRVALAGLAPDMRVVFLEELEFSAGSVGELRNLAKLPYPVDIFMPYRLKADSAIVIGKHR